MLAEAIRRISNEESISAMFEHFRPKTRCGGFFVSHLICMIMPPSPAI
jgi:hypothetical protein